MLVEVSFAQRLKRKASRRPAEAGRRKREECLDAAASGVFGLYFLVTVVAHYPADTGCSGKMLPGGVAKCCRVR